MRTTRAKCILSGLAHGCPSRWRVNGRAVRKRNAVRKLTLRREVFRDVFIERSETLELQTCRFVRIEYGDRLFEAVADCLDWGGKIRISCDEGKSVCRTRYCIHQHFGCDVDIRSLLFHFDNWSEVVRNLRATFARLLVKRHKSFGLLIESFDDLNFGQGGKSLPIIVLAQFGLMVNGVGFRFGCEILDRGDLILGTYQKGGELKKVKPPVGLMLKKSVEQIEAINVNDCLCHFASLEMLRPGLLPALRRIGSASAGGFNPSRGSRIFYHNQFR